MGARTSANDCSLEIIPPLKLYCGDSLVCRTSLSRVRPKPFGKKRVGTEGAPRGRGPGTYTQIAELTSGRTICQQGLATTCKDPPDEVNEVGGRHVVWRLGS